MEKCNSFIIGYSDKYPIIRFSGSAKESHCIANALHKFINNKNGEENTIWDVNVR